MAKKLITETISVKVNSTQQEIMEGVLGNSILPYAKLLKRYQELIDLYERDGYTIVSQDTNNNSFVAEKKYKTDDNE